MPGRIARIRQAKPDKFNDELARLSELWLSDGR
jgi:hypothetical protein